jgi:hypothetical protein
MTPAHMNNYGFIYVPRGFGDRLPFRSNDYLTIEVFDDVVVIYSRRAAVSSV